MTRRQKEQITILVQQLRNYDRALINELYDLRVKAVNPEAYETVSNKRAEIKRQLSEMGVHL